MEISTASATSGLSVALHVLTPLAIHTYKSCIRPRIRNPKNIKKQVLLLPPKGGKGYLYKKLSSQNQYMVIDVDEYLVSIVSKSDVERLKTAKQNDSFFELDLYYKSCADKVLKFVKEQIRTNRKMKVLFLSSSYTWASSFSHDAVCIAAPDSEFFTKILEEYEPEKKEQLRKAREMFLESLPSKSVCTTYHSYEELEQLIRTRLGINYAV